MGKEAYRPMSVKERILGKKDAAKPLYIRQM
jgi:hypothetical protein